MSELSRESLLRQLNTSWKALQTDLAALTEEQLTRLTDAAGWTIKDHLIHLALWERATVALLNHQSKREAMDIAPEIWNQGEDDPINTVIQERYHTMPLSEVMQTMRDTHTQLLAKLETLSEADLLLPYHHYNTESSDERPLLLWLPYDTFHHYNDHRAWIAAIVGKAST